MHRTPTRELKLLAAFAIAQPILALLHETLVIGAASLLDGFAGSDAFYNFVRQFLASPIHAKVTTETLGGIQARGIAVAGLPGQLLYQILPSLFLEPGLTAPGTWSSAVIDKTSTVLSILATQSLVEVALIVFGAMLVKVGLQNKNLWDVLKGAPLRNALSVLLGLFIIAQAIWATFSLTLSPTLSGLRDTGIGVAFSLLLQLDPQRYNWLMDESLPITIPLVLVTMGLGVAWLLGKVFDWIGAFFSKPIDQLVPHAAFISNQATLLIALALMLVISPLSQRYFGMAMLNLVAPTNTAAITPEAPQVATLPTPIHPTPSTTPTAIVTPATPTMTIVLAQAPAVLATPTFTTTPLPTPSPTPIRRSQVEVRRIESKFRLIVNGQPTSVTGMNYNVNYTALPDEVKQRYHRRDFRIMRDAGVNAIVGWGVYDEATLQVAQEFGIGVIMPFELDAKGPYENLNYREEVKSKFRAFVKRFQRFPALWAWNPGGDELLHRMETEHRRTPDKLQAAANFLFELSALAYSLDPDHVSVIKEPRDWYVPYIEDSVRKARARAQQPDPSLFFIYAVNTYGKPEGVSLVLRNVKQHVEDRLGIPVVVGEFAPFGLARSDRPIHYAVIWDMVQEASSLGGFAYVFGPDQPNPQSPNPYDPLRLLVNEFSLVDMDGNPVDGSLNALAVKWRQCREPSTQRSNSPPNSPQ